MSRLRGAWGAAVRVLPSLERLVLLGLVATSMAVSWTVVPVVLTEGARDWEAYRAAAVRLIAGSPLYVWEGVAAGASAYLYPPLMAWLWSLGLTGSVWALAKVVALGAFAWLGPLAGYRRWPIGVLLAALVALSPAIVHDVVLGNVMVFYAAAIVLATASRGWVGAVPLGAVIAFAAKPFVAPYLVWLALRRPTDFGRVVMVALSLTAAGAILVGPGRYVEYLANVPETTVMNRAFSGNVGLSSVSPIAGVVGVVVALLVTAVTAFRFDEVRSAPVGLAATMLAQPTIGVAYGAVLTAALALLWRWDRRRAAPLVVASPLFLLAPVLAGVAIMLAAAFPRPGPWARRGRQLRLGAASL